MENATTIDATNTEQPEATTALDSQVVWRHASIEGGRWQTSLPLDFLFKDERVEDVASKLKARFPEREVRIASVRTYVIRTVGPEVVL